jgi:lambda family phage portal protein
VFEDWRRRVAKAIAPAAPRGRMGARMYQAARNSRLTAGWQTANSSADAELNTSLTALRSRSRALVRDAAYAKRARVVIQNNVIGTGIGLQAQVTTTRNDLAERVNVGIEREWAEWCRGASCHTGGTLHFSDLERAIMGQVFEAGECLVRKHYRAFGDSRIPFALELIEAERLADDFSTPAVTVTNEIRMGIEVDAFGRPVAYWLRERHNGDFRYATLPSERAFRVPASEILHIRRVDRWPQTRGEPWLHAVARKLNDMDGYSEAEIVAARGAASYMGFIETPDLENSAMGEPQEDGSEQMELTPGLVPKLGGGEKFVGYAPSRPNSAMDPFMRLMIREFCAGVGISYESISKDYSQSNYSSSRLSLLDDRDVWRDLQQWFIRSFREPLHREWLQQAVMVGAIPEIGIESYALNTEKFRAVSFKPRGWSWVDPTKEVEAFKEAVRAGFTTTSAVIAATGGGVDIEDVIAERARELAMFEAAGIEVDTTVQEPPEPAEQAAAPAAETEDDDEGEPPARVVKMRATG